MRRKTINNAKLIITVKSNKGGDKLETVLIYDNRENRNLTEDEILERNVKNFLDLEDLKETLNWNLNGDSSKFQFKWGQSGKYDSEGRAYVFD